MQTIFKGNMYCNRRIVEVFKYNNYYVQKGGTVINKTNDVFYEGQDINKVHDIDCFSSNNPINSMEELIIEVES